MITDGWTLHSRDSFESSVGREPSSRAPPRFRIIRLDDKSGIMDDLQNYKLQLQQVSPCLFLSLTLRVNRSDYGLGCRIRLSTHGVPADGLIPSTLPQVEAALTTDPNNEELIKLKFDLKEVIKLTHDLIKSQQQEKRQANGMDAKDPILLAVLANKWKVGDQCMAPWSEDGK